MKTVDFRPEILDDKLFYKIIDLIKTEKPRSIIEIGSATGLGSTQAFIRGIRESGANSTLCCIESVLPRYNALVANTSKYGFVRQIRASSVPSTSLMTEQQIDEFWHQNPNLNIRQYSLEMIKSWRTEDIQEAADIPHNGIKIAKEILGCDVPEMALIDGSAFSGYAELIELWGTKIIILDDVMDIKNLSSYKKLSMDESYVMIEEDRSYRNGYAVFKTAGG